MFHRFLTLLTIVAVTLHALLGCCLHHAHAGHGHEAVYETGPVWGDDSECCGHHHHRAGHEHPDIETPTDFHPQLPCSGSHGPHGSCHEPDCHFVANDRAGDSGIELRSVKSLDGFSALSVAHSGVDRDFDSRVREIGFWRNAGYSLGCLLRVQTQVWRL